MEASKNLKNRYRPTNNGKTLEQLQRLSDSISADLIGSKAFDKRRYIVRGQNWQKSYYIVGVFKIICSKIEIPPCIAHIVNQMNYKEMKKTITKGVLYKGISNSFTHSIGMFCNGIFHFTLEKKSDSMK